MALTDHFYSGEELKSFANKVKAGEDFEIQAELKEGFESEIDEDLLEELRKLSDPKRRERNRKREERIIVALIVLVLAGIAWMIYRFVIR
ncbi:MAG TPA: hypothetical protein VMP01_19495 [Pirellulaceae bacterium]|nr:hypothetical protein [Pirellulaceae bacterium]